VDLMVVLAPQLLLASFPSLQRDVPVGVHGLILLFTSYAPSKTRETGIIMHQFFFTWSTEATFSF
jgi:hypothetical protein